MTKFQETLKDRLWDYGLENAIDVFGVCLIAKNHEDANELIEDSVVGEVDYNDRDITDDTCYWDYRFILERLFNHDTEIIDLDIAYEDEEYEQIMDEIEKTKENIDDLSTEYLADLLRRIGYSRLMFYNVGNRRYYIYTPHF